MNDERTTHAVEGYLNELAGVRGDASAEPVIRALLARSMDRLYILCSSMLFRGYPRLTLPPLNLQVDEMLSALVERLLKALRDARPTSVRHFFALASQHMRWELNDLARRLDNQEPVLELRESGIVAPAESTESQLNPRTRRILDAIENLPDEEREVFNLVRIQGMTQNEAAELLDVSPKTVYRRLVRGLSLLTSQLADLRPI